MTTLEDPHATKADRPGWPLPWPALLIVAGAVWWMGAMSPPLLGFALVWLVIFLTAPFMVLGSMLGGAAGGQIVGGLVLALASLGPLVMAVFVATRTRDRLSRSLLLNVGVGWLAIPGGITASVMRFAEAWPYQTRRPDPWAWTGAWQFPKP